MEVTEGEGKDRGEGKDKWVTWNRSEGDLLPGGADREQGQGI
jgi:hypothetical protein